MLNNELKMVLLGAKKALEKSLEENPKAGLIRGKGTDKEARIRYTEAIKGLEKIDSYFSSLGSLSFGICQDCHFWNTRAHNSIHNCWGDCNCAGKRKETHAYHSCDRFYSGKKVKQSEI